MNPEMFETSVARNNTTSVKHPWHAVITQYQMTENSQNSSEVVENTISPQGPFSRCSGATRSAWTRTLEI